MSDYTTVLIWSSHLRPIGVSYTGHVAMSIDENWAYQGESYVSWWPTSDKNRLARPMLEISMDLAEEGYAPDHIIRIPGLRQSRMLGAWGEIRSKPNAHHRILRKNCATVASRVLKEGGDRGSAFVRNNLVWTPAKFRDLAYEMGGEEQTWEWLLTELMSVQYISPSDKAVLLNLYKRDSRHGGDSSMNAFYYSKGRKVEDKSSLKWAGGKFAIGEEEIGKKFFYSDSGSLLSAGFIQEIENRPGARKREFAMERQLVLGRY